MASLFGNCTVECTGITSTSGTKVRFTWSMVACAGGEGASVCESASTVTTAPASALPSCCLAETTSGPAWTSDVQASNAQMAALAQRIRNGEGGIDISRIRSDAEREYANRLLGPLWVTCAQAPNCDARRIGLALLS